MVYTTQRIRIIPNPALQPISVGEQGPISPTSGYVNPIEWLYQFFGLQYPGATTPTPGTGGGGGLEEPPTPQTCPTGYAYNSQTGQCVLLPAGTGIGQITEIQVPSTSAVGGTIVVKTWIKNNTLGTVSYTVTVTITALGISTTSPALAIAAGGTALVETVITIPTTAAPGTYAGIVTVWASNAIHDSESFVLSVSGAGAGAAQIVPSSTSVQRGQSISIQCAGYGVGEIIDFEAKVGSILVASDAKTTGSIGTAILDSLTFNLDSPLGTAVITATGRETARTANASVTVTAGPTSGVAAIAPSSSSVNAGSSLAVVATNFGAGEIVDFTARVGTAIVATDAKTMDSSGSATLSTLTFATTALGTAVITALGRSTGKSATASVTVLAASVLAAKIVPSATTVAIGKSIALTCTNFGPNETIDFVAKVGTVTVSTDNKLTDANGSVILTSLKIYNGPAGTAVVTGTGRTTGKTATINITVTSTTTGGATSITSDKTTYVLGASIYVTGVGFSPGERVRVYIIIGNKLMAGETEVTAKANGSIASRLVARLKGAGHISARGKTSNKYGRRDITIT